MLPSYLFLCVTHLQQSLSHFICSEAVSFLHTNLLAWLVIPDTSLVPRLSDKTKATKGWGEEKSGGEREPGLYCFVVCMFHCVAIVIMTIFCFYCVVVIAVTSCTSEREVAFSLAGLHAAMCAGPGCATSL